MQVNISGNIIKEEVIKKPMHKSYKITLLEIPIAQRYNIVVTSSMLSSETLEEYKGFLDDENYIRVFNQLLEKYKNN